MDTFRAQLQAINDATEVEHPSHLARADMIRASMLHAEELTRAMMQECNHIDDSFLALRTLKQNMETKSNIFGVARNHLTATVDSVNEINNKYRNVSEVVDPTVGILASGSNGCLVTFTTKVKSMLDCRSYFKGRIEYYKANKLEECEGFHTAEKALSQIEEATPRACEKLEMEFKHAMEKLMQQSCEPENDEQTSIEEISGATIHEAALLIADNHNMNIKKARTEANKSIYQSKEEKVILLEKSLSQLYPNEDELVSLVQICGLLQTYGENPQRLFQNYATWRAIALRKRLQLCSDAFLDREHMLKVLSIVWYPAHSYPFVDYIQWFVKLVKEELTLAAILVPYGLFSGVWHDVVQHELSLFENLMEELVGRLAKRRLQGVYVTLDVLQQLNMHYTDVHNMLKSDWRVDEWRALKLGNSKDSDEAAGGGEVKPMQEQWQEIYLRNCFWARGFLFESAKKLAEDQIPVLPGCAAWRGVFEVSFLLRELEGYREVIDTTLDGPWGVKAEYEYNQMSYGEYVQRVCNAAEKGLHIHANRHFESDLQKACFLMNSYRHWELAFEVLEVEGADFAQFNHACCKDSNVYFHVFKWATWGKALANLDSDKSMSPKDAAEHFKHFTDEFEEACEQLGNIIIFDEITRKRIVQASEALILGRYSRFYDKFQASADFSSISGGRNEAIRYEPSTLAKFLSEHLPSLLSSLVSSESEGAMSSTGEGEHVLNMANMEVANTYSMGHVIIHKKSDYTCDEPFEVLKEPVTQDCQDAFAAGDDFEFSEMANEQHEEEAQSVGIGMS